MKHLQENNMTYWQHFKIAWFYIFKITKVLIKLIVHSFFPFIWENTGYFDLGKEDNTYTSND